MNINMKGNGALLFGAGSLLKAGGLKSATERQERKEKSEREIAFFEKQKENLKNKECATLEEIERKLEMLHTYEDEIAAVKAAYNKEEMFHILDEAREQGEKNAEAAKKNEPKTPEERKKEMAEEALGLDEERRSFGNHGRAYAGSGGSCGRNRRRSYGGYGNHRRSCGESGGKGCRGSCSKGCGGKRRRNCGNEGSGTTGEKI